MSVKYPEPICQNCGNLCEKVEEINTGISNKSGYSRIELWCYCQRCDIETNHLIPSDEKHYPE